MKAALAAGVSASYVDDASVERVEAAQRGAESEAQPMIITRTPFRISFFGGGTDYPSWYREEGGAVLSTTIDKYCYITCRRFPPFFPNAFRIVWSHRACRKSSRRWGALL